MPLSRKNMPPQFLGYGSDAESPSDIPNKTDWDKIDINKHIALQKLKQL